MIFPLSVKKILKSIVSVFLVLLAVYLLDFDAILRDIKGVSAIAFILAVFINLLTFFVMGWRWYILACGSVVLPFMKHVAYYFKATFLNTFTPANLGGDVYRIAALRKFTASPSILLKLIIRERIIGLYGFLIIFTFAYVGVLDSMKVNILTFENPYNYGLMVALAVFSFSLFTHFARASVVSLLRNICSKGLVSKIDSYVEVMGSLLSIKGSFSIMLLSFLAVTLWVASIAVIVQGFGFSIPLIHIAAVACLVELIRLVPITVQGIGLREGAFSYLLTFLGHNSEQGYAVAVVSYLALSVAIVLAGPIGKFLPNNEGLLPDMKNRDDDKNSKGC